MIDKKIEIKINNCLDQIGINNDEEYRAAQIEYCLTDRD